MIIADDDVLLREGLAGLLDRSGMHVLGQAGDARQLLDLVDEHLPDLVLVDIRMPPTRTTETLAAARTIRETHPQVGIVVGARGGRARHGAAGQRWTRGGE